MRRSLVDSAFEHKRMRITGKLMKCKGLVECDTGACCTPKVAAYWRRKTERQSPKISVRRVFSEGQMRFLGSPWLPAESLRHVAS